MKTVEYFCWVRAAAATSTSGIIGAANGTPHAVDARERLQYDEATVAELQTSCPEVVWRSSMHTKPPPSPPSTDSTEKAGSAHLVEKRSRMLLDVGYMTTVHLEQPVAPLELDIDMRPIFGSRSDAMAWIESDAGKRFINGAKAVSLICFTVVENC